VNLFVDGVTSMLTARAPAGPVMVSTARPTARGHARTAASAWSLARMMSVAATTAGSDTDTRAPRSQLPLTRTQVPLDPAAALIVVDARLVARRTKARCRRCRQHGRSTRRTPAFEDRPPSHYSRRMLAARSAVTTRAPGSATSQSSQRTCRGDPCRQVVPRTRSATCVATCESCSPGSSLRSAVADHPLSPQPGPGDRSRTCSCT
jgi:hypothetical protein